MKNGHIQVTCPNCASTIRIKSNPSVPEMFFCPVCESGEIRLETNISRRRRVPRAVPYPDFEFVILKENKSQPSKVLTRI
jgi:hypothetical protein